MLSAGCAIGCGNVWKFPWMCGRNGGGSFMLLYILCLLVLGSDHFLLPAMALIVVCFLFLRRLTPVKKAPSDHTLTRKEETP